MAGGIRSGNGPTLWSLKYQWNFGLGQPRSALQFSSSWSPSSVEISSAPSICRFICGNSAKYWHSNPMNPIAQNLSKTRFIPVLPVTHPKYPAARPPDPTIPRRAVFGRAPRSGQSVCGLFSLPAAYSISLPRPFAHR